MNQQKLVQFRSINLHTKSYLYILLKSRANSHIWGNTVSYTNKHNLKVTVESVPQNLSDGVSFRRHPIMCQTCSNGFWWTVHDGNNAVPNRSGAELAVRWVGGVRVQSRGTEWWYRSHGKTGYRLNEIVERAVLKLIAVGTYRFH